MAEFAKPPVIVKDRQPTVHDSSVGDDAIRATNDDASSCKRWAVQKNYWNDPYLKYFVRSSSRKAPEISRGYYCRTQAVQLLLRAFIQLTNHACQIVNFGAGFDTTFWLLKDAHLTPSKFIDVDFEAITARKCHLIKSRKELLEKITTEDIRYGYLRSDAVETMNSDYKVSRRCQYIKANGEISLSPSELHSDNYHIVAADLRRLVEVETKLRSCQIDQRLPTLFLAECVLVYIDTSSSFQLLKWIAQSFDTAYFVNYEQVNMCDKFGQVMLGNLQSRNCSLHGVSACESVDTQNGRFTASGWDGVDSLLMTDVYARLPQADVQRIEKLEFLDDREILNQLFQHYCLSMAWKDPKHIGLNRLNLGSYQSVDDT